MAQKKSYTTEAQKVAWKKKTYHQYLVNLRYDIDQDLIDYIEANKDARGKTEIFRAALRAYIKAGN